MESTQSPIFNRIEITDFHPLVMLSLNDVFRESMKKVITGPGNSELIVRCDSLPTIKGNREGISRLFETIIGLIAEYPQSGAKRLLYVDCIREEGSAISEDGYINYIIRFNTNITTSEKWMQSSKEQLSVCEKLITDHKGSFRVNHIYNTGCLFSITLAGKFA